MRWSREKHDLSLKKQGASHITVVAYIWVELYEKEGLREERTANAVVVTEAYQTQFYSN